MCLGARPHVTAKVQQRAGLQTPVVPLVHWMPLAPCVNVYPDPHWNGAHVVAVSQQVPLLQPPVAQAMFAGFDFNCKPPDAQVLKPLHVVAMSQQ
jgi:hypothetical protein